MNGFLVGLVLVGAVAAYLLIPRIVGKGINAVDRTLLRPNAYAKARATVKGELRLTAAISAERLLDAIVAAVAAPDSRPAAVPSLYVKRKTAREVVYGFGGRLQGDVFVAAVELSGSDRGSSGVFHVLEWRESGADVGGLEQMRTLRQLVVRGASAAGATVETSA